MRIKDAQVGHTYLVRVPATLKGARGPADREGTWKLRMQMAAGTLYPVYVTAVDAEERTVDALREVLAPATTEVELTQEQVEDLLLPPREEPYFLAGTVVGEDGHAVQVPTAMEEFAIPVRWLEPLFEDWASHTAAPVRPDMLPSLLQAEAKIIELERRMAALEA